MDHLLESNESMMVNQHQHQLLIKNSGHNEQPSSLDVQQHEQLASNSSAKLSDSNELPASSVSNVQQKKARNCCQ